MNGFWNQLIFQHPYQAGYIHESRHKHAMRRPRGPGGRFLSAAEMAAYEAEQKQKEQANGTNNTNTSAPTSPTRGRRNGDQVNMTHALPTTTTHEPAFTSQPVAQQ